MYLHACTVTKGVEYTPGICIFCHKPFDEEASGGFFYGHKKCAEGFERESDRRHTKALIQACPPGTRFDLAGGAACD